MTVCFTASATWGQVKWATKYNGPGLSADEGTAMVLGDGALYVTGSSVGDGSGYDIATFKLRLTDGASLWTGGDQGSRRFDWEDLDLDQFATCIGYWQDPGTGDEYILVGGYTDTESTGQDYLLVAYNENGVEQWYATWDSEGYDDQAYAIALDSDGYAYLVGAAGTSEGNNTPRKLAVVCFDIAGDNQWEDVNDYGYGDYNYADCATCVTVRSTEEADLIYVGGYSTWSANNNEVFEARLLGYSRSGSSWDDEFDLLPPTIPNTIFEVFATSDGYLYGAGYRQTEYPSGLITAAICKFDAQSSGAVVWPVYLYNDEGDTGEEGQATDVEVEAGDDGNVYFAGTGSGWLKAWKFDADGAQLYERELQGTDEIDIRSVARLRLGNEAVYVVGPVNYSSGQTPSLYNYLGAKLGLTLNVIWRYQYRGGWRRLTAKDDIPAAMELDGDSLFATGWTDQGTGHGHDYGTVLFGKSPVGPIVPYSVTTTLGIYSSGNVASLEDNDDDYWVHIMDLYEDLSAYDLPDDSYASIVPVKGEATADEFTSGSIAVRVKTSNGLSKFRIRAWNYYTESWDVIYGPTTAGTTNEILIEESLPNPVSDYIDPANGNEMTLEIANYFTVGGGGGDNPPITIYHRTDLVEWNLTP